MSFHSVCLASAKVEGAAAKLISKCASVGRDFGTGYLKIPEPVFSFTDYHNFVTMVVEPSSNIEEPFRNVEEPSSNVEEPSYNVEKPFLNIEIL